MRHPTNESDYLESNQEQDDGNWQGNSQIAHNTRYAAQQRECQDRHENHTERIEDIGVASIVDFEQRFGADTSVSQKTATGVMNEAESHPAVTVGPIALEWNNLNAA